MPPYLKQPNQDNLLQMYQRFICMMLRQLIIIMNYPIHQLSKES